jgi:hypothetical protein
MQSPPIFAASVTVIAVVGQNAAHPAHAVHRLLLTTLTMGIAILSLLFFF